MLTSLVVVAMLGAGIWVVVAGVVASGRSGRRTPLGIGLLLAAASLAVVSEWRDIDELNPYPIAPSSVVGRWTDGDAVLDLRSDSTYRFSGSGGLPEAVRARSPAGRWELDDWNLRLHDDAGGPPTVLRVVVARGAYRIIHASGDPDDWSGDRGFARVPPSVVRE